MVPFSITQTTPHNATALKSQLVNLGVFALSRGEDVIVQAITRLIERKGLTHA